MRIILSYVLIPLPFILLQLFLRASDIYKHKNKVVSILFATLTGVMFILGIFLIFFVLPSTTAVWIKIILVLLAYMMGRLAFMIFI